MGASQQQENGNGSLLPGLARDGLALLARARAYAEEAARPIWDFAVEIDDLRRAGLSPNDLRWLVCKDYVHHARDTTTENHQKRRFAQRGFLRFTPSACFVLTERGFRAICGALEGESPDMPMSAPAASVAYAGGTKPHWNRDQRDLLVGTVVVKRFRVPAPNQELVLSAFEEEGWPPRIDDPLPPIFDISSKRRLHTTIAALNRNQAHRVLRFRGDGRGEGVLWEPTIPPDLTNDLQQQQTDNPAMTD